MISERKTLTWKRKGRPAKECWKAASGRKLPVNLKIFIHVGDASSVHFSLPRVPSNLTELSDEELARSLGGTELVAVEATVLATLSAIDLAVVLPCTPWRKCCESDKAQERLLWKDRERLSTISNRAD